MMYAQQWSGAPPPPGMYGVVAPDDEEFHPYHYNSVGGQGCPARSLNSPPISFSTYVPTRQSYHMRQSDRVSDHLM